MSRHERHLDVPSDEKEYSETQPHPTIFELQQQLNQPGTPKINLILVEPSGPRNIGNIARLCANFEINELRLVAPRCDPFCGEARQMAVHAAHLLERAPIYPDLSAAIADCRRVVAASGRKEGVPLPLLPPVEALSWLLAERVPPPSKQPVGAALVFGREDRGLSNDELLQAGCLLHIPAAPSYPSINLANAVAVVVQTLWTLRLNLDAGNSDLLNKAPRTVATRDAFEATLADAEALLLEVGFLLPHTARARMAKLRALLQRAQPDSAEVALLRGMVAQLRWAARRPCPPGAPH
jgi:tRNA/rRNA methyltransferase